MISEIKLEISLANKFQAVNSLSYKLYGGIFGEDQHEKIKRDTSLEVCKWIEC